MATPSPNADVERLTEEISDRELATQARRADDPAVAMRAVTELAARGSDRCGPVLRSVVADSERPADVRAMSAVELGHDATPANRKALVDALKGPDTVARRAAEALGRIGDEDASTRLRRMRPRDPVLKDAVDWARTLIAYRLGLDRDLLSPPPPRHIADGQRSEPMDISFAKPSKRRQEDAMRAGAREFPAIELSADGALSFGCGGDDFFAAFTRDVHRRKTLRPLAERPAVLMVVMRRRAALDRYTGYLYVLVHPERDDRLRLFGVRASGILVVAGEVDLADREARIRVSAVPSPHQVPVTVEATYDHEARRISFVTAVIDSDFAPGTKGSQRPSPGLSAG